MFYHTGKTNKLFDALADDNYEAVKSYLAEKHFFMFQVYDPNAIGPHQMLLLEWALLSGKNDRFIGLIKQHGGRSRYDEEALTQVSTLLEMVLQPLTSSIKAIQKESILHEQEVAASKQASLKVCWEKQSCGDFLKRVRQGERPQEYLYFLPNQHQSTEKMRLLFLCAPKELLTMKSGSHKTLLEQEYQRLAINLGTALREMMLEQWSLNDAFLKAVHEKPLHDTASLIDLFDRNMTLYPQFQDIYQHHFRPNIANWIANNKSQTHNFVEAYQALSVDQRELLHAIQEGDSSRVDALISPKWRPLMYQACMTTLGSGALFCDLTPLEIAGYLGQESVAKVMRQKEPACIASTTYENPYTHQGTAISVSA